MLITISVDSKYENSNLIIKLEVHLNGRFLEWWIANFVMSWFFALNLAQYSY